MDREDVLIGQLERIVRAADQQAETLRIMSRQLEKISERLRVNSSTLVDKLTDIETAINHPD